MVWTMARRSLIAAVVIAILAGAWQIAAGNSATAVSKIERTHHDDD